MKKSLKAFAAVLALQLAPFQFAFSSTTAEANLGSDEFLTICSQIENYSQEMRNMVEFLRRPSSVYRQMDCLETYNYLKDTKNLDVYLTKEMDLSILRFASNLENLHLSLHVKRDISGLKSLGNLGRLKRLSFGGHKTVTDIRSLSVLKNLKELNLYGEDVRDLSPLSPLVNLEVLNIAEMNLRDVSPINTLKNLKELRMFNNSFLSDFSALKSLKNLTFLDLKGTRFSDTSVLANLEKLEFINLEGTDVVRIDGLSSLKNLQRLRLTRTHVRQLNGLSSLTKLRELSVSETEIRDLEGFNSLANLHTLDLSDTEICNLEPLFTLSKLRFLTIGPSVDNYQLDLLLKANPELNVYRY